MKNEVDIAHEMVGARAIWRPRVRSILNFVVHTSRRGAFYFTSRIQVVKTARHPTPRSTANNRESFSSYGGYIAANGEGPVDGVVVIERRCVKQSKDARPR